MLLYDAQLLLIGRISNKLDGPKIEPRTRVDEGENKIERSQLAARAALQKNANDTETAG